MDINRTYCGDHFVVYTYIKSLCCILLTNTMLFLNYVSVKLGERKKNNTPALRLPPLSWNTPLSSSPLLSIGFPVKFHSLKTVSENQFFSTPVSAIFLGDFTFTSLLLQPSFPWLCQGTCLQGETVQLLKLLIENNTPLNLTSWLACLATHDWNCSLPLLGSLKPSYPPLCKEAIFLTIH